MADPFSIVAGVAGLSDLCIRFAKVLKDSKDDFQKTDSELTKLESQISAVKNIITEVKIIYDAVADSAQGETQQAQTHHWRTTSEHLKGCMKVVGQLESLVAVVTGDKTTSRKIDKFKKYLRHQSKEGEFAALQGELRSYQSFLQIDLTASNALTTKDIASKLTDLETGIKALKRTDTERTLDEARESTLASAEKVLSTQSLNKHFDPPRAVSSIFTGRTEELAQLKEAMFADSAKMITKQKRFVVYGPPGSGKTEFCSKFASDNKHKFWAVFHIVATSREHVSQDFAQIAKYGRVDANERAAKSWLSSIGPDHPWLLIIDNADDDSFRLQDCYPDGQNGIILITSRMLPMRTQGTIGPRYFEFSGLDEDKSCELLLTAADRWVGCSDSTMQAAKKICYRLGYLPLALTHAGATILERSLRFEDYLDFFAEHWAYIRNLKKSSRVDQQMLDANANIYASYDIIHERLEEKREQLCAASDALDLLRIFAFFDHQRIRIDVLFRAAANPRLEKEAQDEQAHQDGILAQQVQTPAYPWQQKLRNSIIAVIVSLAETWNRPALPSMLRQESVEKPATQIRRRITDALKELARFSLVFYSAEDEIYSMHPAVHHWVRDGPHMAIVDQAVWCNVAATIIALAILPPPINNTEDEEILRRDLLPHVASVQRHERDIRACFSENRRHRSRPWPTLQSHFDRHCALRSFKFSLVYMQGGQLETAQKLQQEVLEFIKSKLGDKNERTMNMKRLLASTSWMLNQQQAAALLRQEVLETSQAVRGNQHPATLTVMDEYGSSLWQQGYFAKALECHTAAVEGFKRFLDRLTRKL